VSSPDPPPQGRLAGRILTLLDLRAGRVPGFESDDREGLHAIRLRVENASESEPPPFIVIVETILGSSVPADPLLEVGDRRGAVVEGWFACFLGASETPARLVCTSGDGTSWTADLAAEMASDDG
jgi:hypothetical protein